MLWIRKSRLVCDMVSQVHMKVGSFILHYIQKSRLVCNWAFQKVGSNILHCGFTSPDLSAAWYLKKVGSFILHCGFTSQDLTAASLWIYKSRLICGMASQLCSWFFVFGFAFISWIFFVSWIFSLRKKEVSLFGVDLRVKSCLRYGINMPEQSKKIANRI